MWYGVSVWGVRIRSKEGDEGGNKRAEGGVGRLGRELWIWISACVSIIEAKLDSLVEYPD